MKTEPNESGARNEVWKNIEGTKGKYLISNKGRIKSAKSKVIVSPSLSIHGYYKYQPVRRAGGFSALLHRLIAQAFIPNPENKPWINHKNCIKTDNRISNLEWCTRFENEKHAIANGLKYRASGVRNGNAILSENDVLKIRELYASGKGFKYLLDLFPQISFETIRRIILGKSWKHLKCIPKSVLSIRKKADAQTKLNKSKSIVSAFRAGATVSEIAKNTGTESSSIYYILSANKISLTQKS